MPAPLVVSIPHSLGREEAIRRLKTGLGRAASGLPVMSVDEERWEDNRMNFRVRALGQAAAGHVDVELSIAGFDPSAFLKLGDPTIGAGFEIVGEKEIANLKSRIKPGRLGMAPVDAEQNNQQAGEESHGDRVRFKYVGDGFRGKRAPTFPEP